MKVAILAGGLGTRLSEETTLKPKPMVEVGGKPILWHIMNIYAYFGYKEFVIALGYKGEVIKDYFLNYHYRSRNMTVNLKSGTVDIHNGDEQSEDWVVHLLDTGLESSTGGRVKKVAEFIGNEPFMMTYGDGVSNVNIQNLVGYHRQQGRLATVTAVRPPARFGGLGLTKIMSLTLPRNHRQVKAGSMVAILFWNPRLQSIFLIMLRHGKLLPWKNWLRKDSWQPTNIMIFGSVWIHCAT